MEFNISVISVEKTTKTSSKGTTYIQLEVSYKDLAQNKVASKKVMPFGSSTSVHKTLMEAKQGEVYTIKSEKNGATSYWDWLDARQVAPGSVSTTTATPAPRSTYETPEERAKKQVYIVKQSSLSASIQLLSVGAKTPPDAAAVISTAQKFTDWVFATGVAPEQSQQDLFNGSFDDMPQ